MKITYAVLYILLIIVMLGCTLLAKRSSKPSRHAVAWLESSLIIPVIGNLLIILTDSRFMTMLGHYIYFIGIDLVLIALVSFTNDYCTGIGNGTQKPTVMYISIGADIFQLLLNPFFGHAFTLEKAGEDGDSYYKLVTHIGQTVHRIVDYFILLCVILILVLASVMTPRIYRARFTVLLASMIAVAGMQAYHLTTNSTYDRPVFGYGFFGLLIFYFAIYYRPLKLLDRMLSNIVSDLSDAFYVFDPNGKCIWANERGCQLVDFSGKNYEEISPKLISMFCEPMDESIESVKLSVGESENVRYYTMEEKKVKDSNGKNNGSYLRIRDVTDEEHEIQVRDEQIGQISQEAYRDALTGVGSKAAYNNKIAELNREIADGLTEIALVMIDMNNLKQINDEFGHKSGDIYIRGCCHMICEAFKHSPVFRVGGDEFVAILMGYDFETRSENVEKLRNAFAESFAQTSQEPWLRYSAAVGIAELAADDNTLELVFKRADKAMYEEKKTFKSANGSYR